MRTATSASFARGSIPTRPPDRPSLKVKTEVTESIVSAFKHWAEFYFHMTALGLGDDDGVKEATRQMQYLAGLPVLGVTGRGTLQRMQKQARDKFFDGKTHETDREASRTAKWDGHELKMKNTSSALVEEEEDAHDPDRCPF